MTDETLYIVNINPDGLDVLHKQHGDERCNRDDMRDRQVIDPDTADALYRMEEARRCQVCWPEGD